MSLKDVGTRAAENAEKRAGAASPRRDQLESQAGRAAPEHLLQGALDKLKRWHSIIGTTCRVDSINRRGAETSNRCPSD